MLNRTATIIFFSRFNHSFVIQPKLKRYKRYKLALLFTILLPACAANDSFRSDISETPCIDMQTQTCKAAHLIVNNADNYQLGFVEIDDQGQFYDRRQADFLVKTLKNQKQAQYVMVYAHGWHHNAVESDFGLQRFKGMLKEAKLNHPQQQVTGIYIGWRGETFTLPVLRLLSFWDRKAVTEEVGRNALLDFLLQVETAVKDQGHPDNVLLTVGHSLGASVIFNALHQVLLQRLVQPENSSVRRTYGDMVVLINPAFEAIRYATLRDAAQRYARQFQFSEQQKPLLIIATSAADNVTKRDFSWSRVFSTLFEAHRTIPADSDNTDAELSEWALDTTALGHYEQYITHHLHANDILTKDYRCSAAPDWEKTAVDWRKHEQSLTHGPITGEGWNTGDGKTTPSLLADSAKLQFSHEQNSTAFDPYWLVQTDNSIFPSHGLIAQKHFWCFVYLAITDAIRTPKN